QQTIRAHHGADSKLRTLSLGMYPDGGWRERLPVSLADEWENSATSARVWQVPEFLLSGLRYAQQPGPHAASRQLMLEGIMLQLLACGRYRYERSNEKCNFTTRYTGMVCQFFYLWWSKKKQ
ncbi:AraC family transcriptional regulator, partial [Salmonella enterica subsp. enterica serovar Enteritidis str. 50-5646]